MVMISIILRSTAQCVPQEEEAGRGESEVQPLIQDQGHVAHQVGHHDGDDVHDGGDVDVGKDGLHEAQSLIPDQGHVSHQVVNGMMAMLKIVVLMMLTRKSAPSYLFLAA